MSLFYENKEKTKLGPKQQKDGFHIADHLKTCKKNPDPPLKQSKKKSSTPPLQGLKKMIDPPLTRFVIQVFQQDGETVYTCVAIYIKDNM